MFVEGGGGLVYIRVCIFLQEMYIRIEVCIGLGLALYPTWQMKDDFSNNPGWQKKNQFFIGLDWSVREKKVFQWAGPKKINEGNQ